MSFKIYDENEQTSENPKLFDYSMSVDGVEVFCEFFQDGFMVMTRNGIWHHHQCRNFIDSLFRRRKLDIEYNKDRIERFITNYTRTAIDDWE